MGLSEAHPPQLGDPAFVAVMVLDHYTDLDMASKLFTFTFTFTTVNHDCHSVTSVSSFTAPSHVGAGGFSGGGTSTPSARRVLSSQSTMPL